MCSYVMCWDKSSDSASNCRCSQQLTFGTQHTVKNTTTIYNTILTFREFEQEYWQPVVLESCGFYVIKVQHVLYFSRSSFRQLLGEQTSTIPESRGILEQSKFIRKEVFHCRKDGSRIKWAVSQIIDYYFEISAT